MTNGPALALKVCSWGGPDAVRCRCMWDFAGEHADDPIDKATNGLQGGFIFTGHQQGGRGSFFVSIFGFMEDRRNFKKCRFPAGGIKISSGNGGQRVNQRGAENGRPASSFVIDPQAAMSFIQESIRGRF